MQKRTRLFSALLFLLIAALACANPLGASAPVSDANGLETVVAATFQALTASAPAENFTATPQPASDSTLSLLPHPIYFLNTDSAALTQVYRLEKDGKSVTQITFEPANVEFYDVSPADGSVAYISNNKMYTVNADGSNRAMIVDGGAMDQNNPYLSNLSYPVFSPDAQTIAYGYKGLNFYSIVSGQSNRVLENQINDLGDGLLVPQELYWPEKYTADGSKLVVSLGYYEGASAAIYYINSNTLVRMSGAEGALICCGNTELTADGSAFYAAYPSLGMFEPGLWRVDTSTGAVTTLITGAPGDGTFHFADDPYLAPDGQLYYFYTSLPAGQEFINRPPLQLVRAAPDGVTNRVTLRPETYENANEALWAPDASFVIIAEAPIQEVYRGGLMKLIYTDGQKGVISLLPFAMEMKWGP